MSTTAQNEDHGALRLEQSKKVAKIGCLSIFAIVVLIVIVNLSGPDTTTYATEEGTVERSIEEMFLEAFKPRVGKGWPEGASRVETVKATPAENEKLAVQVVYRRSDSRMEGEFEDFTVRLERFLRELYHSELHCCEAVAVFRRSMFEDQYGKRVSAQELSAIVYSEDLERINWDSFDAGNLGSLLKSGGRFKVKDGAFIY